MLVAITGKCSQNLLTVTKKTLFVPLKTPQIQSQPLPVGLWFIFLILFIFLFAESFPKMKNVKNKCPSTMVNVLEGSPTTVLHAYPQLLTAAKTKLKQWHQKLLGLDAEQS